MEQAPQEIGPDLVPLTAHICAVMAVNTAKIGGIGFLRDLGNLLKNKEIRTDHSSMLPRSGEQ